MGDTYKYATSTLQAEQITEMEEMNKHLDEQSGILALIAIILALQFILSFIRNIF